MCTHCVVCTMHRTMTLAPWRRSVPEGPHDLVFACCFRFKVDHGSSSSLATGGVCPLKRAPPSGLQVVPLLCRLAGQALRRQRSPPGRQVRGRWSSTVWHGNGCADLARRGTWPSRGLCAGVDCSQMRCVVPICMSMYYAKPILNCGPSSSAKPIILNLIVAVVSQT